MAHAEEGDFLGDLLDTIGVMENRGELTHTNQESANGGVPITELGQSHGSEALSNNFRDMTIASQAVICSPQSDVMVIASEDCNGSLPPVCGAEGWAPTVAEYQMEGTNQYYTPVASECAVYEAQRQQIEGGVQYVTLVPEGSSAPMTVQQQQHQLNYNQQQQECNFVQQQAQQNLGQQQYTFVQQEQQECNFVQQQPQQNLGQQQYTFVQQEQQECNFVQQQAQQNLGQQQYTFVQPQQVVSPGAIDQFSRGDYQVNSPLTPHGAELSMESESQPSPSPMLGASSISQDQYENPQIIILDIEKNIRFRYHSEMKNKKSGLEHDGQAKGRSLGRIELRNISGPFKLVLTLVDRNFEKHPNNLHLISSKEGFSENEGQIVFNSSQKQSCAYDLPSVIVLRAKKESCNNVDNTRVRILFTCSFGDNFQQFVQECSDEITDTKCTKTTNNEPKLVHINPDHVRLDYGANVEITLLGENILKSHEVGFYSADDKLWSSQKPSIFHRKCALVVKVPNLDPSNDELFKVALKEQGGRRASNTLEFRVQSRPDSLSRFATKRTHSASTQESSNQSTGVGKRRLMDMLKNRGRGLETDSPLDGDNVAGKMLLDIAFDVAKGEIKFDPCLCEKLGASEAAMSLSDEDCTPLAVAIISGLADVVNGFLDAMPSALASELLQQRLTDAHRTHFLLVAFAAPDAPWLQIVARLVEAGCDAEACDTDNCSLLHLLFHKRKDCPGRLEELLHRAQEDSTFAWVFKLLNRTTSHGFAMLHEAVSANDVSAVRALLSAGADPNLSSRISGLTALHYAVQENRSLELLRELLEAPDVNVNKLSSNGKTALDFASDENQKEMAELLRAKGGECLYEESSDDATDDDTDDDAEDEEDESHLSEESVPWCDVCRQLEDALTAAEWRQLARVLLTDPQARLVQRASSTSSVFLRLFGARPPADLEAPLRQLGRPDLAELAGRSRPAV